MPERIALHPNTLTKQKTALPFKGILSLTWQVGKISYVTKKVASWEHYIQKGIIEATAPTFPWCRYCFQWISTGPEGKTLNSEYNLLNVYVQVAKWGILRGLFPTHKLFCFVLQGLLLSLIGNSPGVDSGKLSDKHLKGKANPLVLFLILKTYIEIKTKFSSSRYDSAQLKSTGDYELGLSELRNGSLILSCATV